MLSALSLAASLPVQTQNETGEPKLCNYNCEFFEPKETQVVEDEDAQRLPPVDPHQIGFYHVASHPWTNYLYLNFISILLACILMLLVLYWVVSAYCQKRKQSNTTNSAILYPLLPNPLAPLSYPVQPGKDVAENN